MFELYGIHAAYKVNDRPFATGRTSMFHLAADPGGREVCVKLFRELEQMPRDVSQLDEFLREIVARQRLKHPNVLPILDHGVEEGATESTGATRTSGEHQSDVFRAPLPRPFLVLPLCKGGDLRKLMKQRHYTPIAEALPILRPVALAIDFAHTSGIIHGDVKPENVLFGEGMADVFLADFGMSKYFVHRARISRETAFSPPGGGTADYLSPEELDQLEQTPRSDIYSFAMVAYELLVGRLPFDSEAPPFRQMKDKVEGNLIPASRVIHSIGSTANDALICGLSPRADDRPTSATDLCRMLTGESSVPRRRPQTPGRTTGFWRSLPPAGKTAVITALIAALAGVVTALIQIVPALIGK